jgi:hypothetical protein
MFTSLDITDSHLRTLYTASLVTTNTLCWHLFASLNFMISHENTIFSFSENCELRPTYLLKFSISPLLDSIMWLSKERQCCFPFVLTIYNMIYNIYNWTHQTIFLRNCLRKNFSPTFNQLF